VIPRRPAGTSTRRPIRTSRSTSPKRFPVTAKIVGADDPDYARQWKLVNDNNNHVYDGYQARTTRVIPIVALTP